MGIRKVYVSKIGKSYKVSPHFTLGELQSKDGADKVLYSEELLSKLEALRADLGGDTRKVKIIVNSFYRSVAHNRKVGGASNSTHVKGYAADVKVKREGEYIPAELLCCLCQTMGFRGVAYINKQSVHLDMYGRTYRGDERKGYGGNVGGDFYRYFGISKAEVAALTAAQETEKPSEKEEGKENIEEEEEMVYKDLNEVPEWGKDAVKLRVGHGWSDGKDLPESLVRSWVAFDQENPYISDIDDVPEWAKKEVQALIDSGQIKGTGVETIGKRWQVLESLIMAERL